MKPPAPSQDSTPCYGLWWRNAGDVGSMTWGSGNSLDTGLNRDLLIPAQYPEAVRVDEDNPHEA